MAIDKSASSARPLPRTLSLRHRCLVLSVVIFLGGAAATYGVIA